MRTFAAVSAVLLAALFAAGCGGTQVKADDLPARPVVLALPHDTQLAPGAGSASTTASPDASATPTPTPTAAAGTGTGTSSGTSSSGTGGTTSTPATGGTQSQQAPAQQQTQPSTGGANADQGLDQFCQDNPGAC
jgi:hypothetical protein